MTTLLAAVDAAFTEPMIEVYLSGRPVEVLSATVSMGYDVKSSSATITLPKIPTWTITFLEPVEIRMGYKGTTPQQTLVVFRGWIDDDQRGYFPLTNTIKCSGYLRYAQFPYPSSVSYSSQTDTAIVTNLLNLSGLGDYLGSISGTNPPVTFGTVKDVELRAGRAPMDLIEEIDTVTGYITFDAGGIIVRKRWAPIPTDSAVWQYVQGTNIFSIDQMRSVSQIRNRATVTGLPQDNTTISATAQADNPLVYFGNTQSYRTADLRSDLIETQAYADIIALRLLQEVNRIPQEIDLEVPGNPYMKPGMTVGVTSEQIPTSTQQPFWVKHVNHSFDSSGFVTTLRLEGGQGSSGYLVPGDTEDPTGGTSGNPVASFTVRITFENMDTGGGNVDVYTINADGGGSYDPDGDPTALTFAWSNDQNATTSTAVSYGLNFTAAEWANSPVITLAVTDGDGNTGTSTQTLGDGRSTPVLTRELFVAASARAEATNDGGQSWQTWVPGGSTAVICTPEIAPEGVGYYGLSTGALYWTEDWLATSPTLMHTFPAQVNVIWVNEVTNDRITVGLSSGAIYRTLNASLGASSTWTLLKTYGSAVLWLIESAQNAGQYRVATGADIRITFDDFANDSSLVNWSGGTARWGALSNHNNFAAATHADAVKNEDGTIITGAGSDIRAITHHIREDILYVAALSGSDAATYYKPVGATSFTAGGTITGAGQPNHMIRDGDSPLVLYLAAANGLYKTVNGAANWYPVRDYSGVGLNGLQIGYGSAPWQKVTPLTILSTAGEGGVGLNLYTDGANVDPPAGWQNVSFDPADWVTFNDVNRPRSGTVPEGSTRVYPGEFNATSTVDQIAVFRHPFTLSAGIVTSAVLQFTADDIVECFINGIHVASTQEFIGSVTTVNVSPSIFVTGANVATFVLTNVLPVFSWLAYRLDVS